MKIAMVAPPWFPVPPESYGGIESVLALLARGLKARGHDVTMFATGDSHPGVRVTAAVGEHHPEALRVPEVEAHHLAHVIEQIGGGEFDVIHDNSTVYGPLLLQEQPLPVLHTVHGGLEDEHALSVYGTVCDNVDLIAISRAYRDQAPQLRWAGVIPNPVEVSDYPLVEEKDDYVVFMARFSQVKGALPSIRAAQAAGVPIVLAGPVHDTDRAHFEKEVEPLLESPDVTRIEAVGGAEKAKLLGKARALLSPVDWEEPFGLAPVEAMACGTPVIAYPRGALTETVVDGKTGFLVQGEEGIVEAMARLGEIQPGHCREHVEANFSVEKVSSLYEEAFQNATVGSRS
ncbi:MAG TPA: glycosyltransferase family 4 protein [Thermoleophilaceae bacterium]|nr:glycosyltransferase family 4 protein [Thermoleophilaceae bacterium]